MKRVLAFISLLLYLGYITGMVLNTCYLEDDKQRLSYTKSDNNPKNVGGVTNERSGSELPANTLVKIHTHTVVAAKVKPPSSSSYTAFPTVYAFLPVKQVWSNFLSKSGQQIDYVTPIFLRNCVLLI